MPVLMVELPYEAFAGLERLLKDSQGLRGIQEQIEYHEFIIQEFLADSWFTRPHKDLSGVIRLCNAL